MVIQSTRRGLLIRIIGVLPILILPISTTYAPKPDLISLIWIVYMVLWVLANMIVDIRVSRHWIRRMIIRSVLAGVLFLAIPLASFVLFSGFSFSVFNAPLDAKEELRCVLNLETVPLSATNFHIGDDIWTDYIVHIYCELDPADFPSMISEIPFEKSVLENPYTISPPDYAPIPLFTAEETYYIRGEGLTRCMIWTTKAHDRIYVYFGAD